MGVGEADRRRDVHQPVTAQLIIRADQCAFRKSVVGQCQGFRHVHGGPDLFDRLRRREVDETRQFHRVQQETRSIGHTQMEHPPQL